MLAAAFGISIGLHQPRLFSESDIQILNHNVGIGSLNSHRGLGLVIKVLEAVLYIF